MASIVMPTQQDKTGADSDSAEDTMKMRLTVNNVSDGINTYTEIAIASQELNDAIHNKTKAAGELLQRFIRACEDLA